MVRSPSYRFIVQGEGLHPNFDDTSELLPPQHGLVFKRNLMSANKKVAVFFVENILMHEAPIALLARGHFENSHAENTTQPVSRRDCTSNE